MNPAPNPIEIIVAGDPSATPRARFDPRNPKRPAYTPDTAENWKHAIGIALLRTGWRRQPEPPTCPFSVQIVLYFPRPKYLAKASPEALPRGLRPDNDNLEKAIFDKLSKAGVWRDDGQVYQNQTTKLFAAVGASPGARITITAHPEFEFNVSGRRKHPVRNQQPSLPGCRAG